MNAAVECQPCDTILRWTTRAGKTVLLRPITPEDISRVAAYLDGLSFGTRYFGFGRSAVQLSEQELGKICNPSPKACRRFIAVTNAPGGEMQIAAGAIEFLEDGESCELSIHVADAWQGTGVAHHVMRLLIHCAYGVGRKRMQAKVLTTNSRMVNFVRQHGFKLRTETASAAVKVFYLELEAAGKAGLTPRS